MTDSQETTEKLPGTVYVAGDELGTCRYEFTYDTYDTNSMEIVLLGPPEGMPQGPDMPEVKVVTEFSWGRYEISLNRELAGGFRLDMKESRYTAPVTEFVKTQHFDDEEEPATISCGYLFPLTTVTDCSVFTSRHGKHGYVRGKYDEEREVFEPREDSFGIDSRVGELTVTDEFDFYDAGSNLYPETHLVRRSVAGVERELGEGERVEDGLEAIRDSIYDLFQILSLVERTRINWHTERLVVRSSSDNLIEERKRYRWTPAPHSGYRPNRNEIRERRSTVKKVAEAYRDLEAEEQVEVDTVIDNFKTANTARTIETKFIHWHSCLDFFKPLFLKGLPEGEKNRVNNNMSFSMQLVFLFDRANVSIDDLIPAETIENIRKAIEGEGKAPDLPFTSIRNEYIHEGFHSFRDREREAIDLTRKMRALAERLLLSYLDLDPTSTSLGEPSLY